MCLVRFKWSRGLILRRRFFITISPYIYIVSLSIRHVLSFKQTKIPFMQECFVPRLIEIGLVVLEKKMKMWKVYIHTD